MFIKVNIVNFLTISLLVGFLLFSLAISSDEGFSDTQFLEIKEKEKEFDNSYTKLIELAEDYLREGDNDKARDIAEYAYVKARNLKDRARALFLVANVYEKAGKHQKAKRLYRQIIEHYSSQTEIVREAKNRLLM